MLQVINIKKNTKTACSSRVSVKSVNRKTKQFYKEYFTKFYQIKALENNGLKIYKKKLQFQFDFKDFQLFEGFGK